MPTIYQKFKEACAQNPRRIAVYWKSKGDWFSFRYGEFLDQVDSLAGGLLKIGVIKGERLGILSENRPEWLMVDLALNKIGSVSVPIHATANQQLIEHILRDSGAKFLAISQNLFLKHQSAIDGLTGLEKIIILAEQTEVNKEKIILFKDLLKVGKIEETFGESQDLASIIYTSGTTGEAKGVMLSNHNFLANVAAANQRVKILAEDKFLSFMPLSHVLERTAGSYAAIFNGAAIAYAEGIKQLVDNLKEVKPTILISVPKIFEKMYEKITNGIKEKNVLVRKFFFWSLKRKPKSLGSWLADKLIYHKIRKVLGGHLRFAISGGASIDEKILRFFKHIGVKVMEGYGLTETSPVVSVNALDDYKFGTVGQPLAGVEVKIADDKEILIKGETVMLGYWQNQEETKEAMTEDGWLKTGDLGFLDLNNFLTIIGRKKEIIVTTNGKNVAPERIENVINLSPYIEQSVVVGHGQGFLSALIVPNYQAIREKFTLSANAHEIIGQEISKTNEKLMFYERVKDFRLLKEPFTIEADELTPTLKIRRKIIEAKYSKLIASIYD
ncbi:MAG: long-chain fatty acid--CoA ligase [bacterium]